MNSLRLVTTQEELSFSNEQIYDSLTVEKLKVDLLTPDALNFLGKSIADNGTICVSTEGFTQEEVKKVSTNLKFAGYIRVKTNETNVGAVKKSAKKENATATVNATTSTETNVEKLLKADNRVELVMEEELIDPYNTYQKFAKESDCITRPKPCKNCTCGRANELQENVKKDFKPECGKCYLGDAFRCEGCPYRGTPAFSPGDKVQITGASVTSGVTSTIGSESENVNVNVSNGSTVKLDI